MTEEEWLACNDLRSMQRFLRGKGRGRKFRLFACACVRLIWVHLSDQRSRAAVEAAERFADGEISGNTLEGACSQVLNVYMFQGMVGRIDEGASRAAFCCASNGQVKETAVEVAYGRYGTVEARSRCIDLLRCVFGNPFRPVTLAPGLLTRDVVALCQAAYVERSLPSGELHPTQLTILADALEEAGANGLLVSHLRSPGPHVRGCWALDLILGKS